MARQKGGTEVDLMKERSAKTLAGSREPQTKGRAHSPATMRRSDLHQAPGVTGAGRGCATEDGHTHTQGQHTEGGHYHTKACALRRSIPQPSPPTLHSPARASQ